MALGLLSIILVFLLLGYFAGLVAKRRGKSPWIFGGLTIVVVTALSWQHLPRWAGMIAQMEMTASRFVVAQIQAVIPKPQDSTMINQFSLPAQDNIYTFSLQNAYRTEQVLPSLVSFFCKYPTMVATEQQRMGEGVLSININTDPVTLRSRGAQRFLDVVAADAAGGQADNKLFNRHVGKQGDYDLFQRQNEVTGETETTYMFTAKDGQLVLVKPGVFGHNAFRNIAPGIAVLYIFSKEIGNDFMRIDETVSVFIKTRLESQPVQHKGNV